MIELTIVALLALCVLAIWYMATHQPTEQSVRAKQLAEARRMELEHSANAEYHSAMAHMLRERVARLEKEHE